MLSKEGQPDARAIRKVSSNITAEIFISFLPGLRQPIKNFEAEAQ
jgi:hypothetical protein